MKLGLRVFLGYFLIVGLTAWLSLKLVLDELKPVVRQVSEENLVELAHALALLAQPVLKSDPHNAEAPAPQHFQQQLQQLDQVKLKANIWRQQKNRLLLRVYITDANGIVRFDSSGAAVGADYSRWNDVYLTLRGQYGVRSTRLNPDNEQSTVMYVAAPIREADRIIGSLTVAMPNQSTQPYIDAARNTLLRYGLALLGFSLLIGIGFTSWLIWSLRQVSRYALAISENDKRQPPQFARGTELEKLTEALETMRQRLDGKAYVEQYIHTLTHELKSPLAAIQASTELLTDPQMPESTRAQFLHSIQDQSERLNQLIQRLLELAKLEQRRGLEQIETVDLATLVQTLAADLQAPLSARQLQLTIATEAALPVRAERFLLQQALRNLLDNAIAFATVGSTIRLTLTRPAAAVAQAGTIHADKQQADTVQAGTVQAGTVQLQLENQGPPIPAYALPRLGERFYSLPRPDGRKGTGLGLSFVREVLALHGGTLTIENTDAGVRVRVELPINPTLSTR